MAIAEVDAIGVSAKTKPADKLVLVDAYWIKHYKGTEMKVRLLPHQMPVDLFLEFVYEFDDNEHDKDAAIPYDVRFKVEGTVFDEKSTITIDSSKLTKWNPIKKYNGNKEEYKDRNIYYFVCENFVSDLYPIRHRVDLIDEIVLMDAYWEKEGVKIRILPHQKKVTLVVVLGFKYNKQNYDQEKAEFKLHFSVPGTSFPDDKELLILGKDLLHPSDSNKISKIKDGNGNDCFLYKIENFTSDLSEVEF